MTVTEPVIVAAVGFDGPVSSIPLPLDAQRGDLVVACITAVSEGSTVLDPRFDYYSLPGVSGGLVYVGFLDNDFSSIPVDQTDFAGLDAGHSLVVYRGISAIGPRTLYASVGDISGGEANLFPVSPIATTWQGAIAGAVIHTRGTPSGVAVEGPWFGDAGAFTPFYAPAILRCVSPDPPHKTTIPTPGIWTSASISDIRIVVLFGFILAATVQVTRQYPRDDAYGLIGGTRIYPPTRQGRVFGGQQ